MLRTLGSRDNNAKKLSINYKKIVSKIITEPIFIQYETNSLKFFYAYKCIFQNFVTIWKFLFRNFFRGYNYAVDRSIARTYTKFVNFAPSKKKFEGKKILKIYTEKKSNEKVF